MNSPVEKPIEFESYLDDQFAYFLPATMFTKTLWMKLTEHAVRARNHEAESIQVADECGNVLIAYRLCLRLPWPIHVFYTDSTAAFVIRDYDWADQERDEEALPCYEPGMEESPEDYPMVEFYEACEYRSIKRWESLRRENGSKRRFRNGY